MGEGCAREDGAQTQPWDAAPPCCGAAKLRSEAGFSPIPAATWEKGESSDAVSSPSNLEADAKQISVQGWVQIYRSHHTLLARRELFPLDSELATHSVWLKTPGTMPIQDSPAWLVVMLTETCCGGKGLLLETPLTAWISKVYGVCAHRLLMKTRVSVSPSCLGTKSTLSSQREQARRSDRHFLQTML